MAGFLEVLARGVTLVADSGGLVPSSRAPLNGADAVASFLAMVSRPGATAVYLGLPGPDVRVDMRMDLVELNGEPGIVVLAQGRPIAAIVLEVADERVQAINIVGNPRKLRGLANVRPQAS